MSIDPQWVLGVVGAIALALAVKDLATHRRLTPAVKTRLILAAIFAAVLTWNVLYGA